MKLTSVFTKTVEALKAAKAKIDTPEKWTTGAFARDASGEITSCFNTEAACYCSAGVLLAGGAPQEARAALDDVCGCIIAYNDSHTHAEVMAVWDAAIAIAEARTV